MPCGNLRCAHPHAIDATQAKFDLINKGQVSKAKSTRNASL